MMEQQESEVWACILIGGRSRRMGQPKHLLRRGAQYWLERTVAVANKVTAGVVLVGNGILPGSLSHLPRIFDLPGMQGPLAGILAAFHWRPHVSWLALACDLPALNEDALRWLLAARGPETLAILPDLEGNGRLEPLLAYYDQRCQPLLAQLAASGSWRLSQLAAYEGVCAPQPPTRLRPAWQNINTPEQLSAYLDATASGLLGQELEL